MNIFRAAKRIKQITVAVKKLVTDYDALRDTLKGNALAEAVQRDINVLRGLLK